MTKLISLFLRFARSPLHYFRSLPQHREPLNVHYPHRGGCPDAVPEEANRAPFPMMLLPSPPLLPLAPASPAAAVTPEGAERPLAIDRS